MTTASITIAQPATGPDAPAAAPAASAAPTAESAARPAAPTKVERPTWLPEKFKDPEQLAQAYSELEKRLGGQQPAADPAKTTEPAKPAEATQQTPPAHDQGVADLLKANGFDYDALMGEFAKDGKLTDKSYNELTGKFGKAVVDNYFEGQRALADAYSTKIYTMAGGQETYGKVVGWAAANLGKEEIAAYNEAVNSGDANKAQLAVAGIKAKFDAANGSEPALLTGTAGAKSDGDAFRSQAEVTAAMRDPRYQKDAAYRKDVAEKLQRSNLF
jgi:hypothetical protein